jgi:hypothetical protein
MKKQLATLLATLFLTTLIFAQQKSETKPAAKPANSKQPAAPAPLTDKDTLLCKAWKASEIERFKVLNKPEEKEKNDGATFMLDGTAFLTMDGVQRTGTWTTDKTKKWISLIFDNGDKVKLQIFTLSDNELVYEFQDKELVRTKYHCVQLKK